MKFWNRRIIDTVMIDVLYSLFRCRRGNIKKCAKNESGKQRDAIMELNIKLLQRLCSTIRWSVHASERIQQRGIFREDVINAIKTGEIIEHYPDDYPYPSCLVLGMAANGKYLHIVCGCDG